MKLLTPPDPAPSPTAHRLPASSAVRRALRRRGVDLEPGAEESDELHAARIETALMALFRDFREEEHFQALYDQARPIVLQMISTGLRGQGRRFDPQELCQDVFVNVYRYSGSFRDEHARSFRGWVGAIARNAIRRQLSALSGASLQELPEGVAEPADARVGPPASLSLQEERESIARAWSTLLLYYLQAWRELSSRDREALHLIEVEGLSYAQACERLSVGMSNMKMIMFRARRRIRGRIALAMELGGENPALDARRVG